MVGPTQSRAVLKIDVEGHELDVLDGATNLLRTNEIILQVEEGFLPQQFRASECSSYLMDIGYHQLMKLGPDAYYSNVAIGPEQLKTNLVLAETELLKQTWRRFGHSV
jgi:hypothetical protein